MAVNIAKTIVAQKDNLVLPVSTHPAAWRVEIDEFLSDTKMTNLFLLALEKMQKDGLGMLDAKDKVNWWTFYNLSGKLTASFSYAQNLTSGRNTRPSCRELGWYQRQTANRV